MKRRNGARTVKDFETEGSQSPHARRSLAPGSRNRAELNLRQVSACQQRCRQAGRSRVDPRVLEPLRGLRVALWRLSHPFARSRRVHGRAAGRRSMSNTVRVASRRMTGALLHTQQNALGVLSDDALWSLRLVGRVRVRVLVRRHRRRRRRRLGACVRACVCTPAYRGDDHPRLRRARVCPH